MLPGTDVEDPETSVPLAVGQRKRTIPIFAACLAFACFVAALTFTSFNGHPRFKIGRLVGLEGQTPNDDDTIWELVKVAVTIDQLEEDLKDPDLTDEEKDILQKKVDHLKEAFPDWKDVKNKFSEQWDQIKAAVRLEELEDMVESAKESGSDNLAELQEELKKAKEAVPSIDDVKGTVVGTWQQFADQLPDLDDARAKVGELKDYMKGSVESMVDSSYAWVKSWF